MCGGNAHPIIVIDDNQRLPQLIDMGRKVWDIRLSHWRPMPATGDPVSPDEQP